LTDCAGRQKETATQSRGKRSADIDNAVRSPGADQALVIETAIPIVDAFEYYEP
jgi:hypothetical protein